MPVEQPTSLRKLEDLKVVNTFVDELPGDPIRNNATRQVHNALWSLVEPTPANGEPKLVAFSKEVCQLLGLDPEEGDRPETALIFAGSAPLPGGKPYAQCYGGHQFGSWAGQLGDGRAISLGEVLNEGTGARWELQLKGAGPTPYSRRSDGRAVLRSSIREFVASEAFPYLGIPTTRALSLVLTGAGVARDMFYNGDVKVEPGAIVCRVSPSFVRFGTFQLPVSRGDKELPKKLADYVIRHHYTHLQDDADKYIKFLQEVVNLTAELVAKWQLVGFVHGVLNTDNMSVLGLTIDYGPYGFLDVFDPFWTPNLTDAGGKRYSYKGQLEIVQWNLAQLATALIAADLVPKDAAQTAINSYADRVVALHDGGMASKLGLSQVDSELTNAFLRLMYESEADFTNTFRAMSSVAADSPPAGIPDVVVGHLKAEITPELVQKWEEWLASWKAALRGQAVSEGDRIALQNSVNPCYIPRQHLLQYAINDAERGSFDELHTLMEVLRRPFTEQPGREKYSSAPPSDMVRPGISMLSCSS